MLIIGKHIYYTLSGYLSGGDATGGTFGNATTAIIGFFGEIQNIAFICGVASAVCAVLVVAILIATAQNPRERQRAKEWIIAIAVGCVVLAAVGTILATSASIGASFQG